MVLLAIAVIWGILVATRILGRKPRPAWVLDLHRWLGGLSVTPTSRRIAEKLAKGEPVCGCGKVSC